MEFMIRAGCNLASSPGLLPPTSICYPRIKLSKIIFARVGEGLGTRLVAIELVD